jgi:hypothetical protein
MANKMQVVTVGSTSYTAITAPSVDAGFQGACTVARESGTTTVAVSFDGRDDHGRLVDGKIESINFEGEYEAVWLRLTEAGTADVQVIFESRS